MTQRKGSLIRGKYNEYLLSTIAMSASLYLAAIIDNIMIANILGAEALAAANLTSPIVYIKNIVFSIFVYGGNTVCAVYKGKRDNKSADKAFTFSIVFGIIASSVLVLAGAVFAAPTASLLSQNGGLYQLTLEFLIPLWVSGPLVVLNSGIAAYVRTDGLKTIAIALPIVSNIINLFLDYVFMAIFNMGIAGAGWATVAGYAIGSLLLIPYFRSKNRTVHFTKVSFKDIKLFFNVMSTGLATSLIHLCNAIRTMVINSIILSTAGDIGMQVISVCLSAFNVALIFINGSSMTIMPVCGALSGEKDKKGVIYALKYALIITEVMSIIILAIFLIMPQQIGQLFAVKSADAAILLDTAFRIFSVCIPFYGLAYILRAFYQSTGQKSAASFFTVIEGVVIIVPLMLAFSRISANLMWLSFTVAEILSLLITVIIMQIISKKKGKSNYLMLDSDTENAVLDMTIDNNLKSAEAIPREIMYFCKENKIPSKISNALAVSAEELSVNVTEFAYDNKKSKIDICLRKTDKNLILRIRDNGKAFNPTEFYDDNGNKITGLSLVRKLTPNITYNRILSFNVTVVTVQI